MENQNPDMQLEYDRVMNMTPDEKAREAARQLILKPRFGEAERDAGITTSADRTIRQDEIDIMRAQGVSYPKRRV